MRQTDSEELRSILLDSQPRPIVLLGAGASVTSGVPLVRELIEMIGRQAYCWRNDRDFRDTSLVRSDWLPWVQSLPWYDQAADIATLYGLHIEELLQPRERRRRFFQQHVLVSPESASSGYEALASLIGKRRIHTVLTTNFDTLAYDACRRDPSAATVTQILGPDQADLISTDPGLAQVVHLHGVVDHYTDLNLRAEVAQIDQRYQERVAPLIADHPLVVVGYRGAEPSVMRDLLVAAARMSRADLPHGVYWCTRERDGELHPLVVDLAEKCGANFAVVPIAGFDDLMRSLDVGTPRAHLTESTPARAFDGQASNTSLADIDTRRVDRVLHDDALERLALDGTNTASSRARLKQLDLLRGDDEAPQLTNAGSVLFGSGAPLRAVGHADGQPFELAGNIFDLFEQLTAVLAEHNEPYRIKGAESIEVRPYPPLAIKELLVNALGHRSFEVDEPLEISITPSRIRITNPGGLVDPEAAPTLGEVRFKQYRNPAVAEVLYAAGLMDKYGSGLVDVRRWAADGGAAATFELGGDNATFTATLTSRADYGHRDAPVVPGGAYEIFYLNALQVELPQHAWLGPSTITRASQVFDACVGERVPPFVIDGERLLTLSNLAETSNPLRRFVDSFERHDIDDFCTQPAQQRHVVQLLNRSFERHLRDQGLNVWFKRQRAWFFVEADGRDNSVQYQARTRRAVRTVARVRREDTKYEYYEHQAFNWAFVRAGQTWLLTIDPTWVFTQDGERKLVSRQRTTKLSTKKMGNERNQAVLNHLWFWAWVICGEQDLVELEDGGGGILVGREPLTQHAFGLPLVIGDGDDEEADPDDLEEDFETAALAHLQDEVSDSEEPPVDDD